MVINVNRPNVPLNGQLPFPYNPQRTMTRGNGGGRGVRGMYGLSADGQIGTGTVTGSTIISHGQTIDGTKYEIFSGNCPGGKFTLKRPDGTQPDGSRQGDIEIKSSGFLPNGAGNFTNMGWAWCLDFGAWSENNGSTTQQTTGPCNCPPNCREELQRENRFLNKNKLSESDIPTPVKVPRIVCPPKVTEFTTTCAEELEAIKRQHGLTGIRGISGCSSCGTKGTSNRFNGRM